METLEGRRQISILYSSSCPCVLLSRRNRNVLASVEDFNSVATTTAAASTPRALWTRAYNSARVLYAYMVTVLLLWSKWSTIIFYPIGGGGYHRSIYTCRTVVVLRRFLFGAREKTAKNHVCFGSCSRSSWYKNRRLTNARHYVKFV